MKEQSAQEITLIDEFEEPEQQQITKEQVRALLPRNSRAKVSDSLLAKLNNMSAGCNMPEDLLRDDFLGNMHFVSTIKGIGPEHIMNATKYCNLKRNMSNSKAWAIVFPDRHKRLTSKCQQIDPHVSAFNGTQLVQAIDEEMLIPVHLQYAPYFHAAIKGLYKVAVLGDGGLNADGEQMTVTPKVKVDALKELAALTKQPEKAKLDITVNQGEEAMRVQKSISEQLGKMATLQEAAIISGRSIEEVQTLDLVIDVSTMEE